MDNFFSQHKVLWISTGSVVGGVVFLWITKAMLLSMALSMKTGMNISIDDWRISWRAMSFKNLRIRTPSDRIYPTALKVGSIKIKAGLFDLMKRTSQIDSIIINDIFMGVHMKSDGTSNWTSAMQHMNKRQTGTSTSSSTKFMIGNFELNNASVGLTLPGKGEKTYGPTSIQGKNLGSKEPMSIGGLVEFIAKEITQQMIRKYALPNLLQGVVKGAGKGLLSPFKAVKKLFSSYGEEDVELPYSLD